MVNEEAIRRKRDLLATEMQRYFCDVCPDLASRWKEAMLELPPPVLQELAGQLQELEAITTQTNQEVRAALATAGKSAEQLSRALASMEKLTEIAEAMARRFDHLLTQNQVFSLEARRDFSRDHATRRGLIRNAIIVPH